jgi:hypothetical protein
MLVATFHLKKSAGYSTALCGPGSPEYVAFWVDYDNTCTWTYLTTASLQVHDIANIPADGLHYFVAVPAQTAEHARDCKEPKIGRIRAVLSWSTPPSTTDPYKLTRWGNAIESHVLIPPRGLVGDGAEIDIIGGIPIGQIDGSTGLTLSTATFAQWGSPADFTGLNRPCPFGGAVQINAFIPSSFSAAGRKYRLMRRLVGDMGTGVPLTDSFAVSNGIVTTIVTPAPDGTVGYLTPSQNVFGMLGQWNAWAFNGDYEVQLVMLDAANTPIGATQWYRIHLKNTAPTAVISLTGGMPCNKANPGDLVTGLYTAQDPYFGVYQLDTLPSSLNPPAPTIPALTTSPVFNGTWSLQTTGAWVQCGYVVELWVWDRTIVSSTPFSRNLTRADVGFCLGL